MICPNLYLSSPNTIILSTYMNSNFSNITNTINANDTTNYPATYATKANPAFTGTAIIPTIAALIITGTKIFKETG